jgi:hypothetical protein
LSQENTLNNSNLLFEIVSNGSKLFIEEFLNKIGSDKNNTAHVKIL